MACKWLTNYTNSEVNNLSNTGTHQTIDLEHSLKTKLTEVTKTFQLAQSAQSFIVLVNSLLPS